MAITHYKGNRSPSISDTIRIDGIAVDLTGASTKFKMRAEGSSTLVIDEVATIVSAGAGTVRYDPSVTFAALAGGEYLAWWEVTFPSAKTQDTLEFSLTMLEHAPLARGLCELEDVTAYAPGYVPDPKTDALLENLILAETRAIHQQTGREFKAITPSVLTRRFDLTYDNMRARKVRIGDATTVTTVRVIEDDQATIVETVAGADYVTLPRNRQEWEPITALYFPDRSPSPAGFSWGRVVEVTGVWGFPTVPADLREACAGIVVFRYITNAANDGTAFSEAVASVNVGALYGFGREVVESYGPPLVA